MARPSHTHTQKPCCIDKASSAELSEAINSMFTWYKSAAVCIAYLSDLPREPFYDVGKTLRQCRWFKRGWKLQELIAPRHMLFYNGSWSSLGNESSLAPYLSRTTRINALILQYAELLKSVSVGKRMSWAADRETTRVEDIAYCLFGIFGVNMPLLYGEGEKAFVRLQQELLVALDIIRSQARIRYT
ncbi:hypothetical protein B0T25DRAFT_599039 [Lasiosphaeria hispida]|uniref:Uncharacterized protein n=1 Tax=Lasiosphaeria hispida TaxID=260671 RepID=A0AAJ0HXS5_9PEZI|nr:hypothetical protein B0T25DRAFT_599039 [Lasiosphaeria hispida]